MEIAAEEMPWCLFHLPSSLLPGPAIGFKSVDKWASWSNSQRSSCLGHRARKKMKEQFLERIRNHMCLIFNLLIVCLVEWGIVENIYWPKEYIACVLKQTNPEAKFRLYFLSLRKYLTLTSCLITKYGWKSLLLFTLSSSQTTFWIPMKNIKNWSNLGTTWEGSDLDTTKWNDSFESWLGRWDES